MTSTFDGPSGESCLARRETSNTPLQSLTMLNDVMLTDFTQGLARRAVEFKGTNDEKVALLFRLCLVRSPKPDELALLVKFFGSQRKRFSLDPDRADALGGKGEGAADRAAWAAVARTIQNLDEFINKE